MERWNPDLVNANPEILQLGEVLTLCSADWNLPAPHFPRAGLSFPLGLFSEISDPGCGTDRKQDYKIMWKTLFSLPCHDDGARSPEQMVMGYSWE